MDNGDTDFGSGGVMIVPDGQPGPMPKFAVAAGKDGNLYIMDRGNLGKLHTPNIPASVSVGGSWTSPSYFKGTDGIGRVVSSGGNTLIIWKIDTTKKPALIHEASSPVSTNGQDGGFFTSISSNGNSNGIIWAASRPASSGDTKIGLWAFDATASAGTLPLLYHHPDAGSWNKYTANANIVPTVANGQVYVASNNMLTIFGLGLLQIKLPPILLDEINPNILMGTVQKIDGSTLEVLGEDGQTRKVELTQAIKAGSVSPLKEGGKVLIKGVDNPAGVFEANSVQRGK